MKENPKYQGAGGNPFGRIPCDGHRCPNDNTLLIKLDSDVVCVECGEIFKPVNKTL